MTMGSGGGNFGFFSSDFINGFFSSSAMSFRGSGSGFFSTLKTGFSSLTKMGSGGRSTGFSSDFKRFLSDDFRSEIFTNTLDLGVRSGGIVAKIDAYRRDVESEERASITISDSYETRPYPIEQDRRIVACGSFSTEYSAQNVLKVIVNSPESHSTSGECCTFVS